MCIRNPAEWNLVAGHGAVLPPAGTSPHVLACVIKLFLLTLPEPLLTYKCAAGPTAPWPSFCCIGCWLKPLLWAAHQATILSVTHVISLPACTQAHGL